MKVKVSSKLEIGRDMIAIKLNEDEMHAVPAWIDFEVDELPWLISGVIEHDADTEHQERDALPVITELVVRRRPGGPPVSPSMLRGVKLAEVRDSAINLATIPYRREGNKFIADWTRMGDPSGRVAKRALAKRGRTPGREDLEQAVAAYKAAKAEGRTDLLAAVAEACFMSTATAGRRINAAKKAGLLEVDEGTQS